MVRYVFFLLLTVVGLVGCASQSSTSATKAFPPAISEAAPEALSSFTVTPELSLRELVALPELDPNHAYTLPELIRLAQTNNPTTRMAWLDAEKMALAAGMVEATYLPIISAVVIGGYEHAKHHSEIGLGPLGVNYKTDNSLKGVAPALTLKWLLFDFGQRQALHSAAEDLAFASKVTFTGVHQAIIFNVSRTFFEYNAARQDVLLARQHLLQSNELVTAAEERFKAGVGTSIDVAQAKQLAAQAKLRIVQAQGAERDSYHAILGAMGLSPTSTIRIAELPNRQLPTFAELPNDQVLQDALAYRPDLIAVQSAHKAAEKGIDVAEAAFLPKVALLGVVASGSANFRTRGLGEFNPNAAGSAVLLGVSIPIYDGGLRRMQVREAEARAASAKELVRKSQDEALREMHTAANALRTSLEAYEATTELVNAATLTHHAAVESYRVGLSDMILATQTANGLLDATQAQTVAHSAALIASANLAFVMGQLTQAPALD